MMIDQRPLYIDIDGTLTESDSTGAKPVESRIKWVKVALDKGNHIVIWSGNGTSYAKMFCSKHGLSHDNLTAIGKPRACVDDNPNISPSMTIKSPEDFFNND